MIDKRLKLTKKQESLFENFKKALEELNDANVYLLPWDECAHPINMKHVEGICPEDFMKGDKSKYLKIQHSQLGVDLRVDHESCYINARVCIKFKEPAND